MPNPTLHRDRVQGDDLLQSVRNAEEALRFPRTRDIDIDVYIPVLSKCRLVPENFPTPFDATVEASSPSR